MTIANRKPPLLALFSALLLVALAIMTTGATSSSSRHWTETALGNGDSTWVTLEGLYSCIIYGTWDSATADMETEIAGTTTPDVKDVAVAALVGATADTGFVGAELGRGRYRLEISGGLGSEDLTFHCRRVRN